MTFIKIKLLNFNLVDFPGELKDPNFESTDSEPSSTRSGAGAAQKAVLSDNSFKIEEPQDQYATKWEQPPDRTNDSSGHNT